MWFVTKIENAQGGDTTAWWRKTVGQWESGMRKRFGMWKMDVVQLSMRHEGLV